MRVGGAGAHEVGVARKSCTGKRGVSSENRQLILGKKSYRNKGGWGLNEKKTSSYGHCN